MLRISIDFLFRFLSEFEEDDKRLITSDFKIDKLFLLLLASTQVDSQMNWRNFRLKFSVAILSKFGPST
jgi:hypothetical protein